MQNPAIKRIVKRAPNLGKFHRRHLIYSVLFQVHIIMNCMCDVFQKWNNWLRSRKPAPSAVVKSSTDHEFAQPHQLILHVVMLHTNPFHQQN